MTALDRFIRAADSLFSKLGMAATYQPEIGGGLLVIAALLWAVFAFGAHQWLFGVRPFGR